MTKNTFLIFLSFFLLSYLHVAAQSISYCAESRSQATQRQAVASPEHQQLMNRYDVTFYKLDLQLERNTTFIAGSATIEAKVKSGELSGFAFELHPNFQIASVMINGSPALSISRNGSDAVAQLNTPAKASEKVSATIYYSGTAPTGASAAIGSGFSTAIEPNWGNSVTWSLSEPYAAYEWWPTKQVLTDKADSVHVFVTTSAENKVGSNGVLRRVIDLPNNKKRYEWKSSYPIDYYLVSVAVSNYEEYLQQATPAGASKPVPILNYVYSGGALQTFKAEMDRTPGFLEHFSELFSLYPFYKEKYGHSMAPMGGGMEHQTMTTQSTFTFTLTAHELAHQWFGDNVTCASWQDIWLNEGFASYAEYLALQKFAPTQAKQWIVDAQGLALQRPQGSLKVLDTTNVSRIFDYRLSYKKGASVVHMLRFEVNDDALFFKALQQYQQQYGGKTASTADLQKVFEQTTGKDLAYFFEQWYAGNGFPVFKIEWNQEDNRLLLATEMVGSGTTSFFKTDMEYRISTTAGDTTIRVTQDQPLQKFLFRIPSSVKSITPDPNNWILKYIVVNAKNELLEVPDLGKPQLYPNPVGEQSIKVTNLDFSPTTAEVYDMTGKLVRQLYIKPASEATVPVTGLAAGVYQLLLSNGTRHYRSRFVKVNE
ncbi:M1 family aminopeptidase [Pontibacter cellulosilyticus]|uniref:Aminopeptidase N n=1 Tax=Pontibacter cellulosilyticus TaxID=1720253 RepID=A0A923N5A9_9BACT|nr:M1 family aminopeptidase [Pontibacter cellulosilyticus]MBC5992848.1 T9SS type A sorting domain-containing protein [Pontibacter cellulosilyticus]